VAVFLSFVFQVCYENLREQKLHSFLLFLIVFLID